MGKIILFFLGFVVVVVVGGVAAVAVLGSGSASVDECPPVSGAGKTAKQIGDTLDAQKAVVITNADATGVGRTYVGDAIGELRVCFDSAGAHGSGKVTLEVFGQTLNFPFYATAANADLTGSSPKVGSLDFQIGGIPNWALDPAKSQITNIINGALGQIKLKKPYKVEFSPDSAKVTG